MWFVTATELPSGFIYAEGSLTTNVLRTDRVSAGAILQFQLTNGDDALALAMMLLASDYMVTVADGRVGGV